MIPAPLADTRTDQCAGLLAGPFIADALAMPVHWYYNREAMLRDYGVVRDYLLPRNPHPDSILWRSAYAPLNERGDILHEQARYWGVRDVHYHQFLSAGENTLNLQLGRVLQASLTHCGGYDLEDYLRRYVDFMLKPGSHRDTYVEEYHRHFFTCYARGWKPARCGGNDVHIGGLAYVGILCAHFADDADAAMQAVRTHVGFSHGAPEVIEAAVAMTRIVLAVLDGAALRDAIMQHGSTWISQRKVADWSREPDLVVIGSRLSPACYIRDAFAASLYLSWKYADDFESAVIANANAGGDNCHRGAVIGALVGAAVGAHLLPPRWLLPKVPSCALASANIADDDCKAFTGHESHLDGSSPRA
ncbi:hypothetical protein BH11VER1_BH11VER1_11990 [soil metagenome]